MRITEIIAYLNSHSNQAISQHHKESGYLNDHLFSISEDLCTFVIKTSYNNIESVSFFKLSPQGNWIWRSNIYNTGEYGQDFGKGFCINHDGTVLLVESSNGYHLFSTAGLFVSYIGVGTVSQGVDSILLLYSGLKTTDVFEYKNDRWMNTSYWDSTDNLVAVNHKPSLKHTPVVSSLSSIQTNLQSSLTVPKVDDQMREKLKVYADKLEMTVDEMVDNFLRIFNHRQ